MAQLSIALYSREFVGSYHWALALSEGVPTAMADVFQITDTVAGQPKKKGSWRLDHRVNVNLRGSAQFLGCVLLPTAQDVTVESLRDFVNQYGAAQGNCDLPPNIAWSCARWCINILEDFIDADTVTAEKKVLYSRTLARGLELVAKQGTTNRVLVVNF